MKGKTSLAMGLRTDQRLALFGRLRMAEWIEMPESEFAREIESLEKDPLFRKLSLGGEGRPGVIRRQRWPQSRLAGGLFEATERTAASGERVRVEERLEEAGPLLERIRALGREDFERYFLYADEALPLPDIAERTGFTAEEVVQIHDLILGIGVESEFSGPAPAAPAAPGQTCLARVTIEGGEPAFEFFSAYWARGRYQVRYDLVESWKSDGGLKGEELKRLPHLLKRLETLNLRQSTVFRIMESLTKLQAPYLTTKRSEDKRPISLRMLARRLDLAPSTISRALHGRSLQLPWGQEARLIELLPGRRRMLRELLGPWLEARPDVTDASLAERLRAERGIAVSRRTVNAVRAELGKKKRR